MTAIRRFDDKRVTIRRVAERAVISACPGFYVLTGKRSVSEDFRAAVSQVEGGDEAIALVVGPLI
jgi:hypothetical protein